MTRQTSAAARAALVLSAALIAGCYTGKPADFGEGNNGLPDGVTSRKQDAQGQGIYVSSNDIDEACCWLAKDATFRTRVPRGAHEIRLTVFLPAAGPYDERPMDETVTVDGRARKTFAKLRSGIWDLVVPIAAAPSDRDAQVRAVASYAWTGVERHVNGDARELTVQLKDVSAR